MKTPNLDDQLLEFATWFATLDDTGRQAWLDEQKAANAARRRAECQVRGHDLAPIGRSCPHCDTEYILELFEQAEIALFDGNRQVTDWQPYDVETNTAVRTPEPITSPTLQVRTHVGSLRFATWSTAFAGDPVQLPHPSTWTIQKV